MIIKNVQNVLCSIEEIIFENEALLFVTPYESRVVNFSSKRARVVKDGLIILIKLLICATDHSFSLCGDIFFIT